MGSGLDLGCLYNLEGASVKIFGILAAMQLKSAVLPMVMVRRNAEKLNLITVINFG
jgi:hypothetical protein